MRATLSELYTVSVEFQLISIDKENIELIHKPSTSLEPGLLYNAVMVTDPKTLNLCASPNGQ